MEVQFQKHTLSCLEELVGEVRNAEQTQEIKLTDSMPDIGRVVAAWGQSILRAKEWRSDHLTLSAGMLVWVLYAPEDGSQERCLSTWIPFQIKWDLPGDPEEGIMRMRCLTRFLDARSVSPRKIMVRAGMAALGEAFVPMKGEIYSPQEAIEGVELLEETYPVVLNREAGEKGFALDEVLTIPDTQPPAQSILSFRLTPKLSESNVLTDKLVFRGTGNLHVLYRSQEGDIRTLDFDLPFSQYVQLEGEFGSNARADIGPAVTGAELELDDEGNLRFKGGITAQYVIRDQTLLRLTEDAYAPGRELDLELGELVLPVILETRKESVSAEKSLMDSAGEWIDVWPMADFPRMERGMDGCSLEVPGGAQILYRGEDGQLRSGNLRWEESMPIPMDANCRLTAVPSGEDTQVMTGNGQILVKNRTDLTLTTHAYQEQPMVTGLTLGEKHVPDPDRPSLILRRAGQDRLWDIAKGSGTSVAAIRSLNHLEKDPDPDRILLIPVS